MGPDRREYRVRGDDEQSDVDVVHPDPRLDEEHPVGLTINGNEPTWIVPRRNEYQQKNPVSQKRIKKKEEKEEKVEEKEERKRRRRKTKKKKKKKKTKKEKKKKKKKEKEEKTH